MEHNVANVFVELKVKVDLLEESTDFDFIQTFEIGILEELAQCV